jgi:peptidoglycan/xylan/chitin deacetylase (PgdA/CDA1 family)
MQRLTFTFDNGPVPGATERVLEFLAERSIRATFFVVGDRLRTPQGRRLAERAHAEGHWIGNHTLTHGEPLGLSGTRLHVEREIGETQKMLGTLAHPQKLFRPNGKGAIGRHLLSRDAVSYLVEHRFTVATWNNVPRDWEEPGAAWLDRAIAALAESHWSLLVLHDEHIASKMDTLIEFHRRITDSEIEILQDMPPSCLPMRNGEITAAIKGLVATDAPVAVPA